MAKPVSTAQYYPWDGGAIFVGTAGVIPAHAHHAIQICFLFDGCIRLRSTDDDRWMDCDLAIVPSQHRHAMDGSEVYYGATMFVEPETREGRALTERYVRDGIAALDRAPVAALLPQLRAAAEARRGRDAIVELARRMVRVLTGDSVPRSSDERILRAVRYVNEQLATQLTLKQVASVACLSPSRFRHLFAEQTGMGLRQYILWRRLVSVWEHRMTGASLSAAAHAAGFADSAHLTRTSRRMLGIPPSALDVADVPPHRVSNRIAV